MNPILYKRCREAVSAEDAARLYGINVEHGMALCPFHPDKKPSLSFHGLGYHCFGCGKGGDSINFTAELLGISNAEALRRLNTDFRLGLPLDCPASDEEQKQAAEYRGLQDLEHRYNERRDELLILLCKTIRFGNKALQALRPLSDGEALAVYWLAVLEYWADLLNSGDMALEMAVFRIEKEVMELCERILRSIQKNSKAS